jgi:NAD(P)-dependent dehydrogenase (short-subunit alcohol dehydrogenase family)
MAGRLDGRVAIVTGAARGMGAAMARRFVAEGARVVAADVDLDAAAALAASLGGRERVRAVHVDVASEASAAALARETEASFGRIDVLVNNAGIYPVQAFEDISYDDWRRVLAVNLDGAFLVTRAVVPAMKRARWGRVINIGSGTVWLGTPRFAHYAAAKAGLTGFTRCLASELGDFGITVNLVSPGLTATETMLGVIPAALLEARRQQRPIKRHQVAEDVVGAVLFLASDDAAFVTGQTVNVDGGLAFH